MKMTRGWTTVLLRIIPFLALLLLLIGQRVAARPAPSDYQITPWVIAGGGGHSEAGAFVLDGTAGQAGAGRLILAGPYDACVGFWCWGWSLERKAVFLPLVLRNY